MAFEADLLIDRRRLKRSLATWRTLAIIALAGIAALLITQRTGGLAVGGSHVGRLWVEGIILDDDERLDALKDVARNDSVKALVVRIDSPGGTVVGGETLYRALREVSEKKPVVAVIGGLGASAAYMTAIGCDRIFAHEGTVTGSIGVIMQATEVSQLMQKLGITTEAIKSGPLKAAPSPLEPITPAARAHAQEIVSEMFQMFLGMVSDRRKLSPDEIQAVSDGRVFVGRSALKLKLIDEIGGEAEAIAWLEKERGIAKSLPVRDVKYGSDTSGLLDLVGSAARRMLGGNRLTLDGLVAVWHPDLR
jgi:protease-4